MPTRYLYLARHGMADTSGELSEVGRRQADLLGQRLAALPIDALYCSPLPRAAATAQALAVHLPGVAVAEAAELVDHVPHIPSAQEMPHPWAGFLDGYDESEVASGRQLAEALVTRFARTVGRAQGAQPEAGQDRHEILVTHAFQIAWLVRHALDAPPSRWLGLNSANAALTAIQYREGLPPTIMMFNDTSHMPPDLRWTGFPPDIRP